MVTVMKVERIDQIPDFPSPEYVPLLQVRQINRDGVRSVLGICLAGWTRYETPSGAETTLISEVTIQGNEKRGWFMSEPVIIPGHTLTVIQLESPVRTPPRPEESKLLLADAYEQIIANALADAVSCFTIYAEQPMTCWQIYIAGRRVDVIALPREKVTGSLFNFYSQLLREGMAELQESLLGQTKSRTRGALRLPAKK